MWRISGSLTLAVILAGVASPVRPARVQDEAEAEPEVEQPARPQAQFTITDEQFERWIFGRAANAQAAREGLGSRLASKIEQLDAMYALAPGQKKKLKVAGRGDIKRYFDRVRDQKARIDRARGDRAQVRAILLELRPLAGNLGYEGVFDDGSLFSKTLKKTLSPEQCAKHEKRVLDDHRSRVEVMVARIHRDLRLSDDQRRLFTTAVVEQTPPLPKHGRYDYLALLLQASRLPEARIKPIFDESQWRLLRVEFDRVHLYERFLIEQGYFPDCGPNDRRPRFAEHVH
jgi:hypothetical protein